MKKNNIINEWLNQHSDPETEKFIAKNLAITENVRLALEAKHWTKADLAKKMNKKPSEVSKWLSGMHNLTLKSIIKMEMALGIDLIHLESVKEFEYVFLGEIKNGDELKAKAEKYTETAAEEQEFSIAM